MSDQGASSTSVADFCARHEIGRSTFYDLLARGLGPRCMKIGKLRRISAEAEAEWVLRMEAAAREAEAE